MRAKPLVQRAISRRSGFGGLLVLLAADGSQLADVGSLAAPNSAVAGADLLVLPIPARPPARHAPWPACQPDGGGGGDSHSAAAAVASIKEAPRERRRAPAWLRAADEQGELFALVYFCGGEQLDSDGHDFDGAERGELVFCSSSSSSLRLFCSSRRGRRRNISR